jgi:thioredoxin 1
MPKPDISFARHFGVHPMADTAAPNILEIKEADFAVEVEQSPLPVFVDFWAPWCGPCKALASLFDQLAEIYGDQIKFIKINTDDNREIAQRLNIRSIPCLLLFQNGQVVERVAGSRHKAYFGSLLDKYAQRPVSTAKKLVSAFCAFHGDAGLREKVAERVHAHIEAGRIVSHGSSGPISDADQQRYSLMGAAAETADVRRFEDTLGIPVPIGRLQEAVHSLLIRQVGEGDDRRFRLDPPHSAWPVDWWQSIPPGADLQSLSQHFIHWFLRDLVDDAKRYGLDLSDAACSILESVAQLHACTARGDVPAVEEWQAVRHALGTLLKSSRGSDEADRPPAFMVLECVEQLAWPADDLDDALTRAIGRMLFVATQMLPPDGYTPEQWAEEKRFGEETALRVQKAMAERNLSPSRDMTPEQMQSMQAELETLEEYKALATFTNRFEPIFAAHIEKVRLSFGEYLHAGLMRALSATVSSGP